jgi:hypothetical protein
MKKELDRIDRMVVWYLSHDEARARRIIKAAWPKLHVAEKPRKKKQEGIDDQKREAV